MPANPRILVVDDDPDILEIMSMILNSGDFAATTARGGVEALESLRAGPLPQLIILDMMMPGMNGWAFRAEQLKDPKLANIPVIVLTADGHAPEKAAAVGAVAFLKKPLELADLFVLLARHCPRDLVVDGREDPPLSKKQAPPTAS